VTLLEFAEFAWVVIWKWTVLGAMAAVVWALVRANEARRLPPRSDSPYASVGYRGGLRVVRRSIADAVERAP
jgi:hypothetical protein